MSTHCDLHLDSLHFGGEKSRRVSLLSVVGWSLIQNGRHLVTGLGPVPILPDTIILKMASRIGSLHYRFFVGRYRTTPCQPTNWIKIARSLNQPLDTKRKASCTDWKTRQQRGCRAVSAARSPGPRTTVDNSSCTGFSPTVAAPTTRRPPPTSPGQTDTER